MALGLGGGWKVAKSEMDVDSRELKIWWDFARGSQFACPRCGEFCPVHDTVEEIAAYAEVTIVRGLRDGYDLQQETNQARFLEDLLPELRTVWIPCDRRSQPISSTAIRALRKFGAKEAGRYLPDLFAYGGELAREKARI